MKYQIVFTASLAALAVAAPAPELGLIDQAHFRPMKQSPSMKPNKPGPAVANCGEIDADGSGYVRFYSGTGFRTIQDSVSGNEDPTGRPPVTLIIDGNTETCDALNQCAQKANYHSRSDLTIDMHWQISTSSWVCVAYYDPSRASDFDVADSDVGVAYGYDSNYV